MQPPSSSDSPLRWQCVLRERRPFETRRLIAGAITGSASAGVGALIGDRARASMLNALMSGEAISAGELAEALEALALVAPPIPVQGLRDARAAEALKRARTCYDHLAGELGVAVTEALVERAILAHGDAGFAVTRAGDIWPERRPHVAGSLGAGIAAAFFARGWVRRRPGGRAVAVTAAGADWLERRLDVVGFQSVA